MRTRPVWLLTAVVLLAPGFVVAGNEVVDDLAVVVAHARGPSVGLKNDLAQVRDLLPSFDWALNEECFDHDECDPLRPFIDAGKAVFNAEYKLTASAVCPKAAALRFSTIIKNRKLDAARVACP